MSTSNDSLQAPATRLLYSRKEAAFQLSLSVRKIDTLIANKHLLTVRRGGRVLIPAAELIRYASLDYVEPQVSSAA